MKMTKIKVKGGLIVSITNKFFTLRTSCPYCGVFFQLLLLLAYSSVLGHPDL
jgi:hypothetical protein